MAKAIERKFLVTGTEWQQTQGVAYCQGYLNTHKKCTVRIRAVGEKGTITVKGEAVEPAQQEDDLAADETMPLSGQWPSPCWL